MDGNVDGNADATSRALSRARTSLAASRYLAISATRWSGNSWRAMWRGSESELERKEGREEEDVSSFLFGSVAVRGSRSLFLQPRAHSKPLSSKLLLAFFLSLSLSRFFLFLRFFSTTPTGRESPTQQQRHILFSPHEIPTPPTTGMREKAKNLISHRRLDPHDLAGKGPPRRRARAPSASASGTPRRSSSSSGGGKAATASPGKDQRD